MNNKNEIFDAFVNVYGREYFVGASVNEMYNLYATFILKEYKDLNCVLSKSEFIARMSLIHGLSCTHENGVFRKSGSETKHMNGVYDELEFLSEFITNNELSYFEGRRIRDIYLEFTTTYRIKYIDLNTFTTSFKKLTQYKSVRKYIRGIGQCRVVHFDE